jgi:hypothetical protein
VFYIKSASWTEDLVGECEDSWRISLEIEILRSQLDEDVK